jgi:hypothetical protein
MRQAEIYGPPLARWTITAGGQAVNYAKCVTRSPVDNRSPTRRSARFASVSFPCSLGVTDTIRYHLLMAMTLRLSEEQTEALRRKAEAEHRSMQQVAQAAIDAYVHQPTPLRRQSVPVAELAALFGDLPPMNAADFRAEQDRYADTDAYFDAYSRVGDPGTGDNGQ